MAEKGYQGWKNYETWSLALFIDNDRGYYETAREMVREAAAEAPKGKKRWGEGTLTSQAKHAAADALKDWIEETMPELDGPWQTLLQSAFEEIDWVELAEHYLVMRY